MIEETIPIGQSSLRNGLCWKSMESLCADKKGTALSWLNII